MSGSGSWRRWTASPREELPHHEAPDPEQEHDGAPRSTSHPTHIVTTALTNRNDSSRCTRHGPLSTLTGDTQCHGHQNQACREQVCRTVSTSTHPEHQRKEGTAFPQPGAQA